MISIFPLSRALMRPGAGCILNTIFLCMALPSRTAMSTAIPRIWFVFSWVKLIGGWSDSVPTLRVSMAEAGRVTNRHGHRLCWFDGCNLGAAPESAELKMNHLIYPGYVSVSMGKVLTQQF